MKYIRIAFAGLLAAGVGSCASSPNAVRLVADPVAMSSLVGEWNGNYTSLQSGRSGSIVFSLRSVTDTAYGDVVMTPRADVHMNPVQGPGSRAGTEVMPQVLTIRFVRMQGNRVLGVLDPYADPDCECRLVTRFTGLFDGKSRIEGTFESRGAMDHPITTGKWEVKRVNR